MSTDPLAALRLRAEISLAEQGAHRIARWSRRKGFASYRPGLSPGFEWGQVGYCPCRRAWVEIETTDGGKVRLWGEGLPCSA